MRRLNLKKTARLYEFIGIEDGKFVFQKIHEDRPIIIKKDFKKFLYFVSGILFFSAFMDIILWCMMRYMVPCWTLALMSSVLGAVTLSLTYVKMKFS